MDLSILRSLESIGFDDKESRVYLALLELGEATATQIAYKAGVKRSIVYYIVERLQKRGYAQETIGDGVKKFSAVDPTKIFQNVRTAVDDFKFMLPLMRGLQHKGSDKPRIEFFEGKDAVLSVYWTFEHAKDVRYLTSTKRLIEFFPHDVITWTEHINKGIAHPGAKHLLQDTKEDHAWSARLTGGDQQIRFLPNEMRMDMDFAIVDSMLGITSFDPLFIVVIHSEPIARSAGQLFDLAWEQGRIE